MRQNTKGVLVYALYTFHKNFSKIVQFSKLPLKFQTVLRSHMKNRTIVFLIFLKISRY